MLVGQGLGDGDGLQDINEAHDDCQLELFSSMLHCNTSSAFETKKQVLRDKMDSKISASQKQIELVISCR